MMKVLHLTAHLGGGVGKAISGLVSQANASNSEVRHIVVCFEEPQKDQFVERARKSGCQIIICPAMDRLEQLIGDSDIIQLEWWNHPATFKYLGSLSKIPMRLITWSHVSGLHTPVIPQRLILASHKFLFTSRCSYESKKVQELLPQFRDRLAVVSSSGGFSELPEFRPNTNESIAVGYIGSLNFAKLHPCFVDYLSAVTLPGFKVKLIGDVVNQEILNEQCDRLGKPGMLEFRGYTIDIISELSKINVLVYLLNPEHYGTTENALLEAMAMGVVPIVLDNPAERQIVEDHLTGLIVHSSLEFAEAIKWLSDHPEERQRLGIRAAESIRERFSVEKMETALNSHYREILLMEKREIDFCDIFGANPAEWFLSCQGNKKIFANGGNILWNKDTPPGCGFFEKSKGTVFHFSEYFPDNLELKLWAKNMKLLQ
jgi:glycosyltransferase involved in cell wall biosynthesis